MNENKFLKVVADYLANAMNNDDQGMFLNAIKEIMEFMFLHKHPLYKTICDGNKPKAADIIKFLKAIGLELSSYEKSKPDIRYNDQETVEFLEKSDQGH